MAAADTVTLKIPRALYQRLHAIIQGTGFRSVTEFAVYVLRDLASSEASAIPRKPAGRQRPAQLTAREVELVRERLRRLGYLD